MHTVRTVVYVGAVVFGLVSIYMLPLPRIHRRFSDNSHWTIAILAIVITLVVFMSSESAGNTGIIAMVIACAYTIAYCAAVGLMLERRDKRQRLLERNVLKD